MYKATKKVGRFDMLRDVDLKRYEDIVNNPLCAVISERQIKKTEKEFDEETGVQTSSTEYIYLVVTWEEKALL